MISTSNYLKRDLLQPLRLPIPFKFLAFVFSQVPYTVMISTRNWMATNTARKTSSNGNVLESHGKHHGQLKDLLHPKFSVTWINCKPGAVSWIFTGPALVSVSAQPPRQKKTTQDATKTRSDINIPSGTLLCLQTLTANIWKNGLNIHKITKIFFKTSL